MRFIGPEMLKSKNAVCELPDLSSLIEIAQGKGQEHSDLSCKKEMTPQAFARKIANVLSEMSSQHTSVNRQHELQHKSKWRRKTELNRRVSQFERCNIATNQPITTAELPNTPLSQRQPGHQTRNARSLFKLKMPMNKMQMNQEFYHQHTYTPPPPSVQQNMSQHKTNILVPFHIGYSKPTPQLPAFTLKHCVTNVKFDSRSGCNTTKNNPPVISRSSCSSTKNNPPVIKSEPEEPAEMSFAYHAVFFEGM